MSSNVQNCPLEATFKITPEIAARDHVLGMALAPNEARRTIPATKISMSTSLRSELSPWCAWILAPAQRRCISPHDDSIS